jgi:Icc-related predicted phosphoesterase
MKVLSLSDKIVPFIYSPQVRRRFADVDFVLGCGDLPYFYLEYVLNALDKTLFFVRGNHDKVVEYSTEGSRTKPNGGIDLHDRHYQHNGILLAGVEGSLRYRQGHFQSTQTEMWGHVFSLLPGLMRNRLIYGRFLDVFITHAPPFGLHDAEDLPHQGIKAFRWLVETFQPAYFFHGHVHIYRPDTDNCSRLGNTWVINSFGYYETELEIS